jgi:methylase of polypeptide subunit release factors
MGEEGEDLTGFSFMFDSANAKVVRDFTVGPISLKVGAIEGDPGCVQSGQYLWPAALHLCHHLVSTWDILRTTHCCELGAGSGLPGLVLAHQDGVQQVCFTDYDFGSLDLLEENIARNTLPSSVECTVHHLEWGTAATTAHTSNREVAETREALQGKFGLLVGSDLLYATEVVAPLIETCAQYLSNDGVFVLASSFDVGVDIEELFATYLQSHGLKTDIVTELDLRDPSHPQYKIQHITQISA